MNLQFLKYFIVLAETQNFTRAAEKTYVVQSTFSSGIKKLEAHLGCQLFYRDKRNVSLTHEGFTLLPKARKLVAMWHAIETEFTENESKTLQIGKLNTVLIDALVPSLKNFQDLYGQYRVHITEESRNQLFDKLEKGELDAIFIEKEPINQQIFGERLIFEECLEIGVPKNHPLATKSQLEVKNINNQNFIERCNCPLFEEVNRVFTEKDIKVNPVFTAHNNDTVTALIASGIGISLLSRPLQIPENVKFIPLSDANFKREIILVWMKKNTSKILSSFLMIG